MKKVVQISGANGKGFELQQYEEILFPNFEALDPVRGMAFAKEFQYSDRDIVQCTYPKSGTHWIGNILWKLKSFDPKDRPDDTLIEFGPHKAYDNQESPRIIFTHLKPYRLYPDHIENNGKIVLMLRNPKDVAVSYYYHMKNATMFKSKQTWEEYFNCFVEGQIPMGSYFTYVSEWEHLLKQISDGQSKVQLEVFYYEEFLRNPKENLARLNSFLEFNRDEAYLDRILNETTLVALRSFYTKQTKTHETCGNDAGDSVIFRKGQVGDWKTHFTVAQSELVDDLMKKTLQHGLIKFKYEI